MLMRVNYDSELAKSNHTCTSVTDRQQETFLQALNDKI